MITTQLTTAQQDKLLAIDIQHGEAKGFTASFVFLIEKRGVPVNKIVDYIIEYVKPNRSLKIQLFGVHHNLTHKI